MAYRDHRRPPPQDPIRHFADTATNIQARHDRGSFYPRLDAGYWKGPDGNATYVRALGISLDTPTLPFVKEADRGIAGSYATGPPPPFRRDDDYDADRGYGRPRRGYRDRSASPPLRGY
ncbi:hypothetical protein C8J57DRAFT_1533821 [Mycena rebaudengoi]|nr:hypothetical protein C8J57DRAFT_1533821 [Mycena rebaudengoi]